jgi:excisionase family DNA binding protein
MSIPAAPGGRLLSRVEVAALFRVSGPTVTRWGRNGKLASVRTPGGHRRYRESEVQALLDGETGEGAAR